jgi:hypothetical protein
MFSGLYRSQAKAAAEIEAVKMSASKADVPSSGE